MRKAQAALSANASAGNALTVPVIAVRRLLVPPKVDSHERKPKRRIRSALFALHASLLIPVRLNCEVSGQQQEPTEIAASSRW
jgi:hypothetical protein